MTTTKASNAGAASPLSAAASKRLFPLIVTNDLPAVRAFYVDTVKARPSIEQDGYLQIALGDDDDGPELAFIAPGNFPPGAEQPTFNGEGVIVSVPVANADATHDRLKGAGADVRTPPTDKPWGWRSFWVVDPAGVVLDFFHVVAPGPHA